MNIKASATGGWYAGCGVNHLLNRGCNIQTTRQKSKICFDVAVDPDLMGANTQSC